MPEPSGSKPQTRIRAVSRLQALFEQATKLYWRLRSTVYQIVLTVLTALTPLTRGIGLLKVDSHGNLFVVDVANNTIRMGEPLLPVFRSVTHARGFRLQELVKKWDPKKV